MNNVETFYPLSPMQHGMLFHALYAQNSQEYFRRIVFDLDGPLDVLAFQRAWQSVVDRHAILRTGFVWQGVKEPVQVVHKSLTLPWAIQDLSTLDTYVKESRTEEFLNEDATQAFDLIRPPLMRCALLRLSAERHRFIWSLHHLLLDGWSLPNVLREVFAIYDAECKGQHLQLPSPRPYRDYIVWLRKRDRSEAERFWRDNLRGFIDPTPLVVDRPATEQNPEYEKQECVISAEDAQSLKGASRGMRVTLSTLFQGAWAALLARYSGSDDVLYGLTTSGRPAELEGVESMVGVFVNTLPMRVRCHEEERVREWLQRIQSRQLEIEAYSYTSLADIRTWSDVTGNQPLFNSLFVFENYPSSDVAADLNGLHVRAVDSVEWNTLPLTLQIFAGSELRVSILYDSRRFSRNSMSRLLGHFQTLLRALSVDSEALVRKLPILTEAEREELERWNDTTVDYSCNKLVLESIDEAATEHDTKTPTKYIPELIAESVRRHPGNAAFRFEQTSISYRELHQRTNQLANYLLSNGATRDTLIGVFMDRSIEMVLALVGILKAGAAYVPIDPDYPRDRVEYMLGDAQVHLLLAQGHLLSRLPEHTAPVLCLDTEWNKVSSCSTEDPQVRISGDDLAYMIYTSGSTGRPKGAMNTHRGLANRLLWMQEAYGLREDDRVLQKTPFSFDVSVWEFFWPLMTGSTLVVARPGGHRDPRYLVDVIAGEGITTLHFVPSMLQAFLDEPRLERCTSLRRVVCSGEALSLDLQNKFSSRIAAELHNLYGPTEASIDVTYHACTHEGGYSSVPIGRPIANTQIYILDRDLNRVPVGVPGELHIGGVGLARGYWRRPELTAEKFIPNPFSSDQSARLYKTGDLARYLPDGAIEYLGRLDHQVKIRGLRVELGEIEATLMKQGDVAECVVTAREDSPGDVRLVAYFVGRSVLSADTLRDFLKGSLPDYMVPSAYVQLEQMPLTPNGKLDRRALPAPEVLAPSARYAPPRTPIEEAICAVWCDVLHVSRVGVHDNFFELGGHSLLAMQIVARLSQSFDIDLAVRSVFESPTVATLARVVEGSQISDLNEPIRPVGRADVLPLSFAQQRLWFIDELQPNQSTYVLPLAFRVRGKLDAKALHVALQTIVDRHDALRTRFLTVDGKPVQRVEPVLLDLPLIDLCNLDSENRERELARLATEDVGTPFDLARGPLVRAKLIKAADDDHTVLIAMHHIVSDGWSLGIFAQELGILYDAAVAGKSAELPPIKIQYTDFAQWQRERMSGATLSSKLDYWRKKLGAPLPVLELPTDRPRPPVQSFAGAHQAFSVPGDVLAVLKALALKESGTWFMALLTGLYALLQRYTGQEDIIVGSPVAGRSRPETEELIGFFVNTLPLRCDLAGEPSFRDLFRRVRQSTLEAYSHQDLPFEILVDEIQPQRELSRTPLYQVMLVPQNGPVNGVRLNGLKCETIEIESGISKFDLTFYVWEEKGSLNGRLEYNTDLWDASSIERLVGHYLQLLRTAAADPDRAISELEVLTDNETKHVVDTWNATRATYARDRCVHEIVSSRAAECGHHVAVVANGEQLTYAELEQRSNQLAHYLLGKGVGRETIVGICVERSIAMVIGLLGILKAGAAYVPLDPLYPAERLAYMVQDAGSRVLVTQSGLADGLGEHGAELVLLDRDLERISKQPATPPGIIVGPQDLAYVIYTSGSTGKPKGVEIEHGGLLNLIAWHQRAYGVTQDDRATQLAGQAFDASVWEIWPYLTAGSSLYIPDEDTRSSPSALLSWLTANKITLSFLPTPLAEAVLEQQLPSTLALRALLTGGDRLRKSPKKNLGFRLVNHYGPTENTVVATCCDIDPFGEGAPPIGRPISNVQTYVLDGHLRAVPIGVPGRLYVGGDSLARGYHQRPELTSEKFVANPFRPGERLYDTGDLVRYRQDGNLEFLGRCDHQVKIRGFRIELGEIESCLAAHVSVSNCAVLLREDTVGQPRLVAYVASPSAVSVAELRAHLKASLPFYMVPAEFVILDTLPLTTHGKIDRDALSKIRGTVEVTHEGGEPRTAAEEALAKIWAEVLNLERVSIQDNFFELGGDSILSIQVVSRAARAGWKITPKQIFRNQTVAELASVAEPIRQRTSTAERATGEVPLIPIQCWFFELGWESRNAFTQSILCSVDASLTDEQVETAVRAVVAHHDSFRLRFSPKESGWVQTCTDAAPLAWGTNAGAPLADMCAEVEAQLDIENGPVVAGLLARAEGGHRYIFLTAHHLVIDAVSWRIILDDLNLACELLRSGSPVDLPPVQTSFPQWAHLQREWAGSDIAVSEREFWSRELSFPAASLPRDVEGTNTLASVEAVALQLSTSETDALMRQASAHRSTIAEVLLACALYSFSNDLAGDVLIDMEGHGREDLFDHVDLSRSVGWFTSMYPVRFAPGPTPQAALREVKERLRAIPNRGIGYGILRYVDADGLEALPRVSPQVSFNFLGQFQSAESAALIRPMQNADIIGGRMPEAGKRPHEVDVQAAIVAGTLRCSFIYSDNVHRRNRIEEYVERFRRAAAELTRHSTEVLTPTDFRAARIGSDDLRELAKKLSKSATH